MPPATGKYSKGIDGGFKEEQRFAQIAQQKGVPLIDADLNRWATTTYFLIRRALGVLIGNASPNAGFKIVGDGSSNDFIVKGGDGTLNGAGRIWVEGNQCILQSDVRYVNVGATEEATSIYPRISFILGIGNDILQDTGGSYVPGALVGLTITPDVTQPATTATITANTATDITTSIDLTAAGILPGAFYRIELSTPGADRNDGVYLDVYLDEIDITEEPDIGHQFGTLIETFRFLRVRQRVFVLEGDAVGLPGSFSPLIFFDADGFEHFVVKLADISRFNGQAAINAPDVGDLRFTAGNFTNFLNKTGDNMTGDLNMLIGTNIILAVGGLVDGRDVSVDGAKLDTITFTPQGIADQLPLVSRPFGLADRLGVTASPVNISEQLRFEIPRATTVVKGIFTDPPDNRVILFNVDDGDEFIDDLGNKLFARLTEVHPFNGFGGNPVLSGTWTFTNASFNVVAGGGGAATTELQNGDTVLGPDGIQYTVANVLNDQAFDIVEPFAGTTAAIATPPARRWELDLVANVAGAETSLSPGSNGLPASLNLRMFVHKVFDQADRPVIDPLFGVPSDQVAAEVVPGTTTVQGKVRFAADGEIAALAALQSNDARAIARVDSGSLLGARKATNYLSGTGMSLGLADDAGDNELELTIAALLATLGAAGVVKIASDGTTVAADTALATNDPRAGGVKARADAGAVSATFEQIIRLIAGAGMQVNLNTAAGEQQFTLIATAAAFASSFTTVVGAGSINTGALGFTPIAAYLIAHEGANVAASALFRGTGGGDQAARGENLIGGVGGLVAGLVFTSPISGNTWVCTQFSAAGVIASGTATIDAALLVIGQ